MARPVVQLTADRAKTAQAALNSRDRNKIAEYWDAEFRFLVPGNHPYAGWCEGLENFISFRDKLVELSGGSIRMDLISVLINETDGYSIDMNHCHATRAGAQACSTSLYDRIQFDGLDAFKWENGKIVEGYAAIFGDGMTNFNLFLSPVGSDGHRRDP
ncbi:MAG: nuclear transport factor 2 family protein [Pseudonocardiaceae bacterium]